jgi:hypothetical protein
MQMGEVEQAMSLRQFERPCLARRGGRGVVASLTSRVDERGRCRTNSGGNPGTAIIGSLISSLYGARIAESVSSLPAATQAAAEDSVGKAHAIAATRPASEGASLAHAASVAYTDALGTGFAIAAVAAIAAAFAVRRWLPARHAAEPSVDTAVVELPLTPPVEMQPA